MILAFLPLERRGIDGTCFAPSSVELLTCSAATSKFTWFNLIIYCQICKYYQNRREIRIISCRTSLWVFTICYLCSQCVWLCFFSVRWNESGFHIFVQKQSASHSDQTMGHDVLDSNYLGITIIVTVAMQLSCFFVAAKLQVCALFSFFSSFVLSRVLCYVLMSCAHVNTTNNKQTNATNKTNKTNPTTKTDRQADRHRWIDGLRGVGVAHVWSKRNTIHTTNVCSCLFCFSCRFCRVRLLFVWFFVVCCLFACSHWMLELQQLWWLYGVCVWVVFCCIVCWTAEKWVCFLGVHCVCVLSYCCLIVFLLCRMRVSMTYDTIFGSFSCSG